jgi:hypothetical protein
MKRKWKMLPFSRGVLPVCTSGTWAAVYRIQHWTKCKIPANDDVSNNPVRLG